MINFRTFILVTIGLILCSKLFAQSIESGKSYTSEKSFYAAGMPGILSGELLLLRTMADPKTGHEKSFRIDRFDTASLEFKGSWKPEQIENQAQTLVREDLLIWNGSLCLFNSDFIKEKREYRLSYRVIDINGGIGPEKHLLSLASAQFGIGVPRFKLNISANTKWLSVLFIESTVGRAESEISLFRFDSLGHNSGLTQAQIDFEKLRPELVQCITDNDGNYHVMFKSEKSQVSTYSLFAFPVFGNEILEYPMEIPGKEIESIRFSLDKKEKLFVSGFYREAFEKPGQTSGVFFIRTDRESGRIEASSLKLFLTDLKGLNTGEVKAEKELLKNLHCFELFPDDNGNVMLLADSREFSTKCETDYRNGLEVCRDFFKAGNLFVISFDNLAKPAWFRIIPNEQISLDDGGRHIGFMAYPARYGSVKLIRNTKSPEGGKSRTEEYQRAVPISENVNSNGLYTNGSADFGLPFPAYTGFGFAASGHIYLHGAHEQSGTIYKISNQ